MSTYEGGLAVPMIAHWRRAIEDEGEFKEEVAHLIDIAPTVLKLAGIDPSKTAEGEPALPGIDLKPALTGEGEHPARELFFNQSGNRNTGPTAYYICNFLFGNIFPEQVVAIFPG